MMKSILGILFLTLAYTFGYAQNKFSPGLNYTQNINKDSINKVETSFRKANLYFLAYTCTDSAYIKSRFYNKVSFVSADIKNDVPAPGKKNK
jgi:hypothetical protein